MDSNKYILGTFKSNFNTGTWTREEIETMANNYFNRGVLSQEDIQELQNFFEPPKDTQNE